MLTNITRPSAVDVLRPFAVGDTFYADTTSTLAKRIIGTTDQVYIVSGGIPIWSSTVTIATLSVVDSGFRVVGSSDATKKLAFEVDAQTAGKTLTVDTGAQTVDRTISVPVLGGNRTLAVIDQAQSFNAIQTISDSTASTSTTTGALVVAGGVGVSGAMFVGGVYSALIGINIPGGAITAKNICKDAVFGTNIWTGAGSSYDFSIFTPGGGFILSVATGTTTVSFAGAVEVNSAVLLKSNTTLTNGAGASLGTLTNAPAAGNPTKWISINDNGTVRQIPCW